MLEEKYVQFNRSGFVADDPIAIPHRFTKKEDVEIMAFLVALIAWGQRSSIIKSGEKLIALFDGSPYAFISGHSDADLRSCTGFVHRTFNDTDLLSLIAFLKELYSRGGGGLENAFSVHLKPGDRSIEHALNGFRMTYENSAAFVQRTAKHIAWPAGGSACKRLNMFLRWMVRKDVHGVDFGIWNSISPAQLVCPLDVHVIRQAYKLKLISSEKSNWKTALELTERLKKLDANDPVKYDFALFGLGIEAKEKEQMRNAFV